VAVAEAATNSAPSDDSPVGTPIPASTSLDRIRPDAIHWSQGLPAATISGVVAAVLMVSSQGSLGIGIIATGALTVVVYSRRVQPAKLSTWTAARLAALSGAIAFSISVIFVGAVVLFTGTQRLQAFLIEVARQSLAMTSNPLVVEQYKSLMDPANFPELVLFYSMVFLVTYVLFSTLGGLLGALWVRIRSRR
jgi:hypothetical protein